MRSRLRLRRLVITAVTLGLATVLVLQHESFSEVTTPPPAPSTERLRPAPSEAATLLGELPVKGRAPKTGYSREQFGGEWELVNGCDARNTVLRRDLTDIALDERCRVLSGVLHDPYTGKVIQFQRGAVSSQAVQIDHVVAASNAWQTGAQQLDYQTRVALYNDPLELLAVDGKANNQKSDGDAATWLPPNKPFRCQYIARQIAVKKKYHLWVTPPEKAAMERVLSKCPGQRVPTGALGS